MGTAREPLCPRCGAATYERINGRESRCAECGLGRTSTPLRIQRKARAGASPATGKHETDPHAEARQRTLTEFANASFPPCGLDDRWEGTRWFGGSGASNDTITRLELAHGEDPWEPATTQVRVEVRLPRPTHADKASNVEPELAMLTRKQVSRFWMATGTLDPDVRAAAFHAGVERGELTAPWADAELTIDGTPLRFRRLGDDEYWLAQALHGGLLVDIDARAWPVASTGLVTIEDLTPYVEGSELIAARGRSRFT